MVSLPSRSGGSASAGSERRGAELRLLGDCAFSAADDGIVRPVDLGSRRIAALLAYLALQPGLTASRERLADLFWGETSEEHARMNLRQLLRRALLRLAELGCEVLEVTRDSVRIRPGALWCDAVNFAQVASGGASEEHEQALALLRGPLGGDLDGVSPAFDEWLRSERRRFGNMQERLLGALLEAAQRAGDGPRAIDFARRLVALDPLDEELHRTHLRLTARFKGRLAAQALLKEVEALIRAELDADLAPATRAAAEPVDEREEPLAAPVVVIMPFRSLGGEVGSSDLAQGLSEELATGLGRFRWMGIVGRFHGRSDRLAESLRDVGREIGANYMLDGTARIADGKVRVTVHLGDVASDRLIWSERYDRPYSDIFALQDDITERVLASVETSVVSAEAERAMRASPDRLGPWGLTAAALTSIHRFERTANERARGLLQRAIEIDTGDARARALLSWSLFWSNYNFWVSDRAAAMEQSVGLAQEALSLDPEEPWAHMTRGFSLSNIGQHAAAVHHLEGAIRLNAGSALARTLLAWALVRAGQPARAVEETSRVLRISDTRGRPWLYEKIHGLALLAEGRFAEARPVLQSAATGGDWGANAIYISCCGHLGLHDEARRLVQFRERSLQKRWCVRNARQEVLQHAHRDILMEGLLRAGVPED